MKQETADEMIACLSGDRNLFHYFKGEYALKLLSLAIQKRKSVGELKRSPYQRLLGQPLVKRLLAKAGSGQLPYDFFDYAWHESSEPFVLTLARWGSADRWWDQVSRPGFNLVLQLNFSEKHNQVYKQLVKPGDNYIFNYDGHPVTTPDGNHSFRDTLAWARLDVDLTSGEVLIEEIQSDWVRGVIDSARLIQKGGKPWQLSCCDCKPENFIEYVDQVFAPFVKIWSEAMMMAAIGFIYAELGVRDIYYHTYHSGAKIKQIGGNPPRSLYSDLPRKFCFQITQQSPNFLERDRTFIRKKRRIKDVSWYKLEL